GLGRLGARALRPLRRHRRVGTLVVRREVHAAGQQRHGRGRRGHHGKFAFHHAQTPSAFLAAAMALVGSGPSSSWAYSLFWRSLPLKKRRTTRKNTGTKITASKVAVTMPD